MSNGGSVYTFLPAWLHAEFDQDNYPFARQIYSQTSLLWVRQRVSETESELNREMLWRAQAIRLEADPLNPIAAEIAEIAIRDAWSNYDSPDAIESIGRQLRRLYGGEFVIRVIREAMDRLFERIKALQASEAEILRTFTKPRPGQPRPGEVSVIALGPLPLVEQKGSPEEQKGSPDDKTGPDRDKVAKFAQQLDENAASRYAVPLGLACVVAIGSAVVIALLRR